MNGLKSILSRSGVEANLLDNVTMEIVEINYMGQRLIKTCRWLVLDHDHMPIATHQTLEEIEAREAKNRSRRNLSLIVNRDNLTWEVRMNSRSFFVGKLVGLGDIIL